MAWWFHGPDAIGRAWSGSSTTIGTAEHVGASRVRGPPQGPPEDRLRQRLRLDPGEAGKTAPRRPEDLR